MAKRGLNKPPPAADTLNELKDFQQTTVNYVFDQLYSSQSRARRFLIADEVGLGKTLVAKGIIAKAAEHLLQTKQKKRIDVVYICSNQSIARQNISRLTLVAQPTKEVPRRLTLLPLFMKNLHRNTYNFVSFTPGTSFDFRSSGGISDERALIYNMIRRKWRLGSRKGPRRLLQCHVGDDNWKALIKNYENKKIEPRLKNAYLTKLKANGLHQEFDALSNTIAYYKHQKRIPEAIQKRRYALIGNMRLALAEVCIEMLEPDIVVMDEFQRFRDLLNATDETGRLAQLVFQREGTRILLLSATPYKMYTMYHEHDREDHYQDFLNTVGFLMNSKPCLESFKSDLQQYRELLMAGRFDDSEVFLPVRQRIETTLRRFMARTEKLGATDDRSGMLTNAPCGATVLKPGDLGGFKLLDRITGHLRLGDPVEYWKSAPYLVNLMDRRGYQVKVSLDRQKRQSSPLTTIFQDFSTALLPWEVVKAFHRLPAQNGRLRELIHNKVDNGGWQLLWVPASLPYYRPSKGPYADRQLSGFTKSLLFSSWLVVPKAIAMLTSYEAERRMVTARYPRADYEKESKRPRLLQFNISQGRLSGMNVFNLIYPCVTLATKIDPLAIAVALNSNNKPPAIHKVVKETRAQVARLLRPITKPYRGQTGREDERWYWVAMAALDHRFFEQHVADWFGSGTDGTSWEALSKTTVETEGRFTRHVQAFRNAFDQPPDMGRVPKDLEEIVTRVALASPAVVTLRAFMRIPQGGGEISPDLLQAAARVGMGFRNLFNQPETMAMVRSLFRSREAYYWKTALLYCLNGNIQSVMDEYLHMLVDSLGLTHKTDAAAIPEIAEAIYSAVSLRAVNLDFDEIVTEAETGSYDFVQHSMRCRFAMRFGDGKSEEQRGEVRKEHVRNAFNSPFRPFVLATTSIGQEGLDFHQYCHEIYHWNLPANPVDLEQREGRIHRYKGHVIRRNIAGAFPLDRLRDATSPDQNPWQLLFDMARQSRSDEVNDLVPFWIFEGNGEYKIRRYVPMLPLCRESEQFEHLLRSLAAYRLVLGQPRQEDLVQFLQGCLLDSENGDTFERLKMDLSPR